jgi:hypothetical protein
MAGWEKQTLGDRIVRMTKIPIVSHDDYRKRTRENIFRFYILDLNHNNRQHIHSTRNEK